MSETASVVDCAAYAVGRRVGRLPIEEAGGALQVPEQFVWVGLYEPGAEVLEVVQRQFHLHDLAVEDARSAHQRPKLELYQDSLFVVLRTAQLTTEGLEFGETHVFVGARYLVSVRHGSHRSHAAVRARCEATPHLLAKGPAFVLHALMDFIVDQYFPIMDQLEDQLEDLEGEIFGETMNRGTTKRIYSLRRELVALKRAVLPLIDVCSRLMRFDGDLIPPDTRPYFRDVYDHVVRINEMIDTQRELLTTALDANLSLVSVQQNEHTQAARRLGRHDCGADDDRGDLRDELPRHAGARMGVRVFHCAGRDARRLRAPVRRLPALRLAVADALTPSLADYKPDGQTPALKSVHPAMDADSQNSGLFVTVDGTTLPLSRGGTMTYFALAVLGGATWYFMTTEDRAKFVWLVRRLLVRLRALVIATCFIRDPLTDALRGRTRWIVVVPVIAALNVALYLRMMLATTELGHADAMIAWGANFVPRTGNGEWWRLVSATFLHPGVLSLFVNTGALISAGRVLERLVGSVTFGTVYVLAGVMGALASLWISAVDITASASAAVFGMYGLLLACWMWGAFRRSTATVRLASVKALAVPAVIFICYNLATNDLQSSAEIAGVVTGFISGLLLARRAAEQKPRLPRVAAAVVSAAVIVFVLSEPVRGVVDPRPDIAAALTMEQRTAARYDAAVGRFQKGTVTSRDLAVLIDRTIIPQVKVANLRINALGRVAGEHQEVVADARDYLRIREEAWRLRAQALQKASMPLLRDADRKEQLALRAFNDFSESARRISVYPAQ